jgi:hypothetical protein
MKTLIYLSVILFCFLASQFHGQTFSNNITNAHNTWDSGNAWATALSKTITVSGVSSPLGVSTSVLKQINIRLGNGSNTGLNLSTYNIRLYHPNGTTFINICTSGGQDCGGSSIGDVNIKYRDNLYLKSIGQLPSGTPSAAWPYHIGYYRVVNANDFATFNGLNPNGDWVLKIVEASSTEIAFSGVDLIFGSPITVTDLTSSNTNDACSNAQCTDNSQVYIGTNNGYSNPGPATDPGLTVSGCSWNGQKNNSAWFYFVANGSNVNVTISGLSAILQSIGLSMSGGCGSPTYALPTGGCPGAAVNDNYQGGASYGVSGMSYNHQLNFSGLISGNTYYVFIDGSGGAISPFYLEMTGNTASCLILLPVELTNFHYSCHNDQIKLNWSTATEKNISHFTILGSTDANEWFEVGIVNGAGNSLNTINYNYDVPAEFSSLKYFKLSQTDFDGTTSFSSILFADCEKHNHVDFFPNPFSNELNFKINSNASVSYEITTVLGQIVNSGIVNKENSLISLENLAADIYFIKINNSKVHKIIKQ